MSRLIDADALKYAIVEEGQRSRRYKLGDFWELNGEEIRNVIDAQPTIEPQQWIPISSNPITTGLYLVLCNEWGKNRYRICAYYSEVGKWIENGKNIAKFITHWMPLPEPWKGGVE